MSVILDGDEMKSTEPIIKSVEWVLNEVQHSGRYVQTVLLNGVEVAVDRLLNPSLHLDEESSVAISTCTLDELVENSMNSVYEYVPGLCLKLERSAAYFRIGDISGGSSSFVACEDGLSWNLNMLTYLSSLHYEQTFIHQLRDEGSDVVPLLLDAWEYKDYVSLADIIEYELLPWLLRWHQAADLFQQQMKLEHMKQQVTLGKLGNGE